MRPDLADLDALLAVAEAGGFREAARKSGLSASGLSDAVRRLETRVGLRLLNRTTRSVAPTEAGSRLLERLGPALGEVGAALRGMDDLRDRPAGLLRLNVPVSAARLVLPAIVPGFLAAYPDRSARAALRVRGRASLPGSAGPARAPARPPPARLPAPPLRRTQPRLRLGVRA